MIQIRSLAAQLLFFPLLPVQRQSSSPVNGQVMLDSLVAVHLVPDNHNPFKCGCQAAYFLQLVWLVISPTHAECPNKISVLH